MAIVTPFKNQDVDYASLERLIEHIISNGVEYIVTLGTTGEVPVLTREEKRKVATFTLQKIKGRVPCVIGIGGNNTKEIVADLKEEHVSQFDAVLSVSPYYSRPSQEGIYQHYKQIGELSPKPVILYNVPARTGSNITAETALRLANDFKNIAGIKEASGSMVQGMHILKNMPADFLMVSGDDHLAFPLVACGADGVISVIANSHPRDFSELIRAGLRGNFQTAQKLQMKVLDAIDLIFAENNPAGVKCFLAQMGLIENEVRLPNVPASAALMERIKSFMKNY